MGSGDRIVNTERYDCATTTVSASILSSQWTIMGISAFCPNGLCTAQHPHALEPPASSFMVDTEGCSTEENRQEIAIITWSPGLVRFMTRKRNQMNNAVLLTVELTVLDPTETSCWID